MAEIKVRSGGMGLLSVLVVVFITLKLCGVIDWSWWWVLAPFWIPLAVLGLLVLLATFLFVASSIVDSGKR